MATPDTLRAYWQASASAVAHQVFPMPDPTPAGSLPVAPAPPHVSVPTAATPQSAQFNARNVDIHNSPVDIASALRAEWEQVLSQWITRAATSLRDHAPTASDRLLPIDRWRACLGEARSRLPDDLAQLVASDPLCDLFGLALPLPETFRSALLGAAAEEAREDAMQGRVDAQAALQALIHIERCVQLPARAALGNPVMQPLFAALHTSTPFGANPERMENVVSSDGPSRSTS